MVEIPGSENQLREIVLKVGLLHPDVLLRKTVDAEGAPYILILNGQGDEVAEWDEDDWVMVPHPRRTGTIENTTDLTQVMIVIDKQVLLARMRAGRCSVSQTPPGGRL